ncbi:MAG TPA: SH3 domain-containing protein [Sphingomonas sp.]|jgi:hypothetical protein|uniref:SH3 domain-containing protein n=1 Tax=Sphingomonas sp. TaxID=28214 RepID=UPI002ED9F1F3
MTVAPTPEPAARRRFALTGRSVQLDPLVHAVRRDLADVRLADRVFAPHYAAPAPHRLARTAALRSGRQTDSTPLADLAAGDMFEVLEFAGDHAWGIAPGVALVGYVDTDALEAHRAC